MSILAPLYLLGLAAISLPLIFHLIRRTPRGEMPFSSLMFLSASPPRLTRRSRLDNWLLLLLRGLALALLAFAFARPFLRQAALATPEEVSQQRVVVLVDTSASMRRGDLWAQATEAANQVVSQLRPEDQYAVYAFDDSLRPIASRAELAELQPASRAEAVSARMQETTPTWASTHLGQALADALTALEEMQQGDAETMSLPRRVVLISDMQQGSRLNMLAQHDWPKDVQLQLVAVEPSDPTNAGVEQLGRLAEEQAEELPEEKLRIRVTNAADSAVDAFQLEWLDGDGKSVDDPVDMYIPAGESRVSLLSPPTAEVESPRLVLRGDAHDFDNTLYYLPTKRAEVELVYVGEDKPDDPQGMQYYLQRALRSDQSRDLQIVSRSVEELAMTEDEAPQLIVMTSPPAVDQAERLREFVEVGGTLLYVITEGADAAALETITGAERIDVTEAEVDNYAMFGEIDFEHPLFAAMAGPQFNNFTQILFWQYRQLEEKAIPEANVLARFDTGDPAVLEQKFGSGSTIIMTAGWHPADSQLARSWKFLLMLSALVERDLAIQSFERNYLVNEPVQLPSTITWSENPRLTLPDGQSQLMESHTETITSTDQPGVYTVSTRDDPVRFVVHVDPTESSTAPLAQEEFEQVGCQLSSEFDAEAAEAQLQQMRDVELESRQKVWKWLVATVLAILIIETALAGWKTRTADASLATA